jgi:protein O-GlcNAc transferase
MQQAAPSTGKLMKLAEAAVQKGRHQEAFELYQQVLNLDPHHAEALFQLARALHNAGDYASAALLYGRAIQEDPQHVNSYVLLCAVYDAQKNPELVLQLAQKATERLPDHPKVFSLMASALLRYGRAQEALAYLENALPRFPADIELLQYYCLALKTCDRFEEAEAVYRKLVATQRIAASFRMQFETHLPRFNESNAQIDAVRAGFAKSIEDFTREKPAIDLSALDRNPLFGLTYHNRDNKELAQSFTKMLRTLAPQLNFVAPHCKDATARNAGPIRVGFLSQRMHNHVVGYCYRGVLLHLAKRADFSVTFFNTANVMDSGIQEIIDANIPIVSLPTLPTAAQAMVANHALDILVYPDIGMDLPTHFMAMARLAPYQLCLGGHPETTGIDTVDYVVASREYEPDSGQENYTERLLCIDGAATVFKRPAQPERWLTRAELELPEDRKLYICPMAVHKFHPDFDVLLANILEKDPQGTLVLFHDFHEQTVTDALKKRLFAQCDPARIIFLPWLKFDAFQGILKLADAVLDTIGFGGGTTSQYAFDLGVPIVTMPGRFARGRMVHSYYEVMEIDEAPVAASVEEYVDFAVRLANDRAYYAKLQKQILARNERLFARESQTTAFTQLLRDIHSQQLDKYKR